MNQGGLYTPLQDEGVSIHQYIRIKDLKQIKLNNYISLNQYLLEYFIFRSVLIAIFQYCNSNIKHSCNVLQ